MVRAGAPSHKGLWMLLVRHSCCHFLRKCLKKWSIRCVGVLCAVRIAAFSWERGLTLISVRNFSVTLHISLNLQSVWMCFSVTWISQLFKRLVCVICAFLFSETGFFNMSGVFQLTSIYLKMRHIFMAYRYLWLQDIQAILNSSSRRKILLPFLLRTNHWVHKYSVPKLCYQ